MAKNYSNDTDGVWRTIGGRRIFIKNGKDLSTAMKESGKFKKSNAVKDEELKKKIGNDVKKLQEYADKEGILPSELQDRLGIKDSDLGLKDDYTEKFEQEMQGMERYLKAEDAKKATVKDDYNLYKKAKENPDSIDPMTENSTDWEALDKKYSARYEKEQANTNSQDEDRETFKKIADFYGYNKMDNDAIRRTLDEAENKGLYHSKNDIEAMRRYLDRTLIEKDTGSAYSKPGKRWEVLEESKSAFGDKIYKVRDEEGNVSWEKESKFVTKTNNNDIMNKAIKEKAGVKDTALSKSVSALNTIDKIAGNDKNLQKLGREMGANSFQRWEKSYREYMKEHPNSKIDLYKFIKMNK